MRVTTAIRLPGGAGGRAGAPGSSRAGDTAGFTLVELMVGLVLVASLAAVLLPNLLGRIEQGQAASISRDLSSLGTAIHAYRSDVGQYPAQLVNLTTPPGAGTLDACGRPLTSPALWNGPYLNRTLVSSGLPVGASTIASALRRVPLSGSSVFATLFVDIAAVDRVVAEQVERSFDGDPEFSGGSIRWAASGAGGQGMLSYAIPIRGC
jgi:prepilin-type N-terminal cleavage/methylation domain-containing protein